MAALGKGACPVDGVHCPKESLATTARQLEDIDVRRTSTSMHGPSEGLRIGRAKASPLGRDTQKLAMKSSTLRSRRGSCGRAFDSLTVVILVDG